MPRKPRALALMNGQGLNSSALKKPWGCPLQREVQSCDMNIAHALTGGMGGWGSLAFEPAYEGKGVKHPLTPEAPDFSRGVAHSKNFEVLYGGTCY